MVLVRIENYGISTQYWFRSYMLRGVSTLCEYGQRVLTSPQPEEKVRLTQEANRAWRGRTLTGLGDLAPPAHIARPSRPELKDKREMPSHKDCTHLMIRQLQEQWTHLLVRTPFNGRLRSYPVGIPLHVHLLHSLAHIEVPVPVSGISGDFSDWLAIGS